MPTNPEAGSQDLMDIIRGANVGEYIDRKVIDQCVQQGKMRAPEDVVQDCNGRIGLWFEMKVLCLPGNTCRGIDWKVLLLIKGGRLPEDWISAKREHVSFATPGTNMSKPQTLAATRGGVRTKVLLTIGGVLAIGAAGVLVTGVINRQRRAAPEPVPPASSASSPAAVAAAPTASPQPAPQGPVPEQERITAEVKKLLEAGTKFSPEKNEDAAELLKLLLNAEEPVMLALIAGDNAFTKLLTLLKLGNKEKERGGSAAKTLEKPVRKPGQSENDFGKELGRYVRAQALLDAEAIQHLSLLEAIRLLKTRFEAMRRERFSDYYIGMVVFKLLQMR